MNRINVMMNLAVNLASGSKCTERKVAAVITDKHMSQVLSIGVNGGPKKLFDCLCVTEGKYGCIHAEVNALIKCRSDDEDKIMFTTLAPCNQCAAAIINAPGSFKSVMYKEDWKENSGLKLLQSVGITTIKVGNL